MKTLDIMNNPQMMSNVLTLLAKVQEIGGSVKIDIAIWFNGIEVAEVQDLMQLIQDDTEPEPDTEPE